MYTRTYREKLAIYIQPYVDVGRYMCMCTGIKFSDLKNMLMQNEHIKYCGFNATV